MKLEAVNNQGPIVLDNVEDIHLGVPEDLLELQVQLVQVGHPQALDGGQLRLRQGWLKRDVPGFQDPER